MQEHAKHKLNKVLFYLVYMWLTFKGDDTGSSFAFELIIHF